MPFWLQNLWSNIIWSATDGSSFLSRKWNFGSKTKISHFYLHVITEEEISKFEISMDDFFVVKVIEGLKDLEHKESGLILSEPSFSFDEIIEGLENRKDGTLLGQSSRRM